MTDEDAVRYLVARWHESRTWAERLLCEQLSLQSPQQILDPPYRGNRPIPGTLWSYRTHGLGVEVSRPGNSGGIDFDFRVTGPDVWSLRDFLVKQYNAGILEKRLFRPLLEDAVRWDVAVSSVLSMEQA